jgi:hypothetical protein
MATPPGRLDRHLSLQRPLAASAASAACASSLRAPPAEPIQADPLPARIRRTALAELDLALAGRTRPARIEISLHALPGIPATADADAVRLENGTLHLRGNTPRGVLHAVFALQEALAGGAAPGEGINLAGRFHFSARIFHARFDPWPGGRPEVRFLAHLGATHCLVSHDWQGSRRSMQGYVTSPIFPAAVDATEVAANHAGLRRLLDHCSDYGLGAMLWLTELPCQGGPWLSETERNHFLARFPSEVLGDSGTYEGKVLCFSHPRVQAFYGDLLRRFFGDFPEIETIFLFGLDSSGEFCDPETCPRCRGMSRIRQRDRLICFLVGEGQKVRPGLRVLTTGWKWDQEPAEFLHRQARLPSASGVYLAAAKDGWQCERQSHDFLHTVRRVTHQRGQLLVGYDNFHWGDDTVHGIQDIQDFPLGIGAKIRRWHALGADGVFDHWGNAPEDIWSNSVACRDFFLNPRAEPAGVAQQIARRQFGAPTGRLVLAAWVALERAHVILSPVCTWSPGQWPGWYDGRKHLPWPGQFSDTGLRAHQAPPRREGDALYNPPGFATALQAVADAWALAAPHYDEAVAKMEQALASAGDSALFYGFWWNGEAPPPSRREHVRRQLLHLQSMAVTGREIGLHFGLHAMWERDGRDPRRYREQAAALLKADIAACRAAAEFFQTLGKPRDWGRLYAEKAAALEHFLAGGAENLSGPA